MADFNVVEPGDVPSQFKFSPNQGIQEIDATQVPKDFLHQDKTSTLGALGLGAAQGLTAGFSDEVYGALKTLLVDGISPSSSDWSKAYNANRDAAREMNNTASSEHPVANTVGDSPLGHGGRHCSRNRPRYRRV